MAPFFAVLIAGQIASILPLFNIHKSEYSLLYSTIIKTPDLIDNGSFNISLTWNWIHPRWTEINILLLKFNNIYTFLIHRHVTHSCIAFYKDKHRYIPALVVDCFSSHASCSSLSYLNIPLNVLVYFVKFAPPLKQLWICFITHHPSLCGSFVFLLKQTSKSARLYAPCIDIV